MPIKPENRSRYPANWPEIRSRKAIGDLFEALPPEDQTP
ncbi:Uncharacterised protein [Burkholderia pseudomallei]|nr:Uncharacterised protein [Burkholderia pseudomallei]